MPGPLGKMLVMPPVPLLTSTFNKSSGGLGEHCGPNASFTETGKLGQVGPPKNVCSCKPQQAAEAISCVPQGPGIGPILFVIYANDLSDNLSADSR